MSFGLAGNLLGQTSLPHPSTTGHDQPSCVLVLEQSEQAFFVGDVDFYRRGRGRHMIPAAVVGKFLTGQVRAENTWGSEFGKRNEALGPHLREPAEQQVRPLAQLLAQIVPVQDTHRELTEVCEMLVLLTQVGEEQGDLFLELVDLVLVVQDRAYAEDELDDLGVGSIPGPVLSLTLGRTAGVGQVGGKLVGNVAPASLCLSQSFSTYEFALDDNPLLAPGLAQVYHTVLALA